MLFSEDVTTWGEEHFSDALFSHRRRSERLITLACAFAAQPGKSIPKMFDRPYDVKATYTFLNHPEATPDNLQAGHREQVMEALHQPGEYLLIEDSTELSWSGNLPVSGLGPIGSGAKGLQGFTLHSVLAARWPQGLSSAPPDRRPSLELLGLADQQYHVRTVRVPKGKQRDRKVTEEELESHIWEAATERLGTAPSDSAIRWVRVCDCGADIYEFLLGCLQRHYGYVVRAWKDRVLLDEHGERIGRLFEGIRAVQPSGGFSLELRGRPGRSARTAKLSVSFESVCLRSPRRPGHEPGRLPAITGSVIRVWEVEPPEGVEGLEWVLLTDGELQTYEQAKERALQYAARWLIEEFHKALKTGLGAERLQLETAHGLFAAIAIMSVAALRLIDLRERGRLSPDEPAEASGLDPLELKLLSVRLNRTLTTIRDVTLAIGRLGGHMNRKSDGMPGWQTLWEGWKELQAMVAGARLLLQMQENG